MLARYIILISLVVVQAALDARRGQFQLPPEFGGQLQQRSLKKSFASSGALYDTYSHFTIDQLDQLPSDYLCSGRLPTTHQPETCCTGKNKECFTIGGCFCDESCQNFDDCCPDYKFTCAAKFKLCLDEAFMAKQNDKKPDSNENLKSFEKNVLNSWEEKMKKIKGIGNNFDHEMDKEAAGADNAHHLAPNACCGMKRYNDGEQCCCLNEADMTGELVDGPCTETSCI